MRVSDPAATRQRLLDAAWRVLNRHGEQHLSLDAVAREAGVSKGGLLHHFPTRAALIDAIYDRWNDDFETAVACRAVIDKRPGSWARAYLDVSTGGGPPADATAEVGFLAALVADPERLRRFRERFQTWQDRIEQDRNDPAAATLVRLAAEGLWLADLLGLAPPTGELRVQMLDMLRELTLPAGLEAPRPDAGGYGAPAPEQPADHRRTSPPSPVAPG